MTSLRQEIAKQGAPAPAHQPRTAMVDVLLRIPGELTDLVARPVALASLLVAMVLGGWIGGVNASLDTVPGDVFYGVKLASERAQLTLAAPAARAQLHDEFASRRLGEVERLIESGAGTTDDRVQTALNGFKKQIDGAQATLADTESEKNSVELARIIDEKSQELEVVLELAEEVQDKPAHDAVSEQIQETEEVQEQAVETLAEKAPDSYAARRELERQYTDALRDMRLRSDLLIERIERIATALEERGEEELAFNAKQLAFQATDIDLTESKVLASDGIYPEAFRLLGEEKDQLRAVADELLAIEIALTAPTVEEETAEDPVVSEEAAADETPTLEPSNQEATPDTE